MSELDERTDAVIQCLRHDAIHEPPAWLDAHLRSQFSELEQASRIRPFIASGLASAAFLAVLAGLASTWADTGFAEWGPVIAVMIGIGYLAISAAAALPLLIEHRQRTYGTRVEV